MNINLRNELLYINVLVVLFIIITLLIPLDAIRIVLGIPFVFFCPGYVIIVALFPRKEQLDTIERIVLSFGLSIAVLTLLGMVISYTPWGLKLEAVLYSIASLVFIMSVVAYIRRKRLPEQQLEDK